MVAFAPPNSPLKPAPAKLPLSRAASNTIGDVGLAEPHAEAVEAEPLADDLAAARSQMERRAADAGR